MRQLNSKRTWFLAAVLGAAGLFGSLGLQMNGVSGHPQAGYVQPPPPMFAVHS